MYEVYQFIKIFASILPMVRNSPSYFVLKHDIGGLGVDFLLKNTNEYINKLKFSLLVSVK